MKNRFSIFLVSSSIVIAIVIFGFKTQQATAPEQVAWDTHYFAEPDENSAFAALTVTTWQYTYNAIVKGKNLHIDFKFKAGVVPARSWVKRNRIRNAKASKILLSHEQGHVDINFLFLRESEKIIRNQKYTISNYKKLIVATANKVDKFYGDMQERYDVETEHGSNEEAQSKWDEFLSTELKKYR